MKPLKRWVHGKELLCGYTTGSCAAAAAKGAVQMMLEQKDCSRVTITTPGDILLDLDLHDRNFTENQAECSVVKFSGDDPDITNGFKVFARVEKSGESGVEIDGGVGVGRVTKPGLSIPVGKAAINPVPLKMIESSVREVVKDRFGVKVTISIPQGVEAASKTFNPRLGITGGISVLGTTGIVEPMSQEASKDSLVLELKAGLSKGYESIVLVPGKYGENFTVNTLGIPSERVFFTGNFIGDLFTAAEVLGVKQILLAGHIGKLVKVAGGIFNTWSRVADGRMEIMSAIASLKGGDSKLTEKILNSTTTDEALDHIEAEGIDGFGEALVERMTGKLKELCGLDVGVVVFSLQRGVISKNSVAEAIIRENINE